MKIIGVIPARYGSSRFPGKPLADICGRPMIWWVHQQAKKVEELNEVYVATDDERIADVCRSFDMRWIMTDAGHRTAANRMWEVAQAIDADFYVGINGDEPAVDPVVIAAVIPENVPRDVEFGTNIITNISDPAELMDSANIKVVFDAEMNALYMSRFPIPYPEKTLMFKYYKHVGILGYNRKMLEFYGNSKPGNFEKIEGIDTMRFLDYGKKLKFVIVENVRSLSVDTPKDLEKIRLMYTPPPVNIT
jgi:3-deoxy-manno-octulosonate cytidylyltransferase (CMP-KDO synthetase)